MASSINSAALHSIPGADIKITNKLDLQPRRHPPILNRIPAQVPNLHRRSVFKLKWYDGGGNQLQSVQSALNDIKFIFSF